MLDARCAIAFFITTTFAGMIAGAGGGSAVILKRFEPMPAPVQATRAFPAPLLADLGTLQRHETVPRAAFLVVNFVASAPERVIVALHLLPAGATLAVMNKVLPAVTLKGTTRTRTAPR